MTADDKSILKSILEHISGMDYIKPEDLPNIDLYMDQVTTFMEDQLASTKRHDDDKILTKTMINNYAKNNLLPSPEKKRYSKDHLLMLIFIYYFKNILSITDIQKLLGPITAKYFKGEPGKDMTYVYNEESGKMEYTTALSPTITEDGFVTFNPESGGVFALLKHEETPDSNDGTQSDPAVNNNEGGSFPWWAVLLICAGGAIVLVGIFILVMILMSKRGKKEE